MGFLESVWQKKLKNASTNKQNVIWSKTLTKIFINIILFLSESSDMNDYISISDKYSDHLAQLPTLWTYYCFSTKGAIGITDASFMVFH